MAVQIQVTEPLSAELMTALNDWLTTRLTNIIDELATYDVGPPPPAPTAPPVNTMAPVVEQARQQSKLLDRDLGWHADELHLPVERREQCQHQFPDLCDRSCRCRQHDQLHCQRDQYDRNNRRPAIKRRRRYLTTAHKGGRP